VRKDLFNKYFGEDALSKPVPKWEPPEGTLVNPEVEDFVVKRPPPKDVEIEKRFGSFFSDFYEKSTAYIDEVKPIPEPVKKELEKVLAYNDKTVDEFINEVNNFVKEGEVVRHDDLDNFLKNIDDFEKDPRIKTQFETGTSQGAYSPEDRNFWERKLSGNASTYGWKASDSDKTNYGITNKHRPVYGEVTTFHPLGANAAEGYGEMAFVISDKAKERASFTLDNSSNEGITSFKSDVRSVFSKPEVAVGQNADNFKYAMRKRSGAYVEAQVWGGIDLSKGDVKAIVIADDEFTKRKNDTAFQRFLQVLNNNGVKVIKGSEWKKKK
jgi:hypothetical protein